MFVLDYLIYHLRPYGIVRDSQPLPRKLTSDNSSLESSSNEDKYAENSTKSEVKTNTEVETNTKVEPNTEVEANVE